MRYALISDIHANLPALDAVLSHIQGDAFDAIYHLGDLVGYAPWPNEVVERIRTAGIPGVAGNYDSTVATDYKHCGCRYEDAHQEELSHLSYDVDARHVSAANEVVARSPSVPARPPAARRTRLGADADARSWQSDAQHRLRHRRSVGRFSGEDGRRRGARRAT